MSPDFPPRPSRRAKIALAVVALVTLLYSVVVAAQLLLWFALVGVAIGLYLTYLLIVALFRLVEAVERIATAAEVDSGIGAVDGARASAGADGATGGRPEADASEDPTSEGGDGDSDASASAPAPAFAAEASTADTDGPTSDDAPGDEPTGSDASDRRDGG